MNTARELWSAQPIVGFDTETTGVNAFEDRLVTASIVVASAEGVTKYYWLADPEVEIPQQATSVHGIATEQAQREGAPIKKVLDEVAQLLCLHLEQNHVLVAFNAAFDLTLMESELARHNLPTIAERLGGEIGPVIDPFMLDKTVDKYRSGKRNLETMAKHYGVWRSDEFHNAEADVLATLRVLGAILRRYPDVASADLSELMRLQRETYLDMVHYFATHPRPEARAAASLSDWPVSK